MLNGKKCAMLMMLAMAVATMTAQAAMLKDAAGNQTIYASGLWHFDGNMDEVLGTGSTSSAWWGYDWAGAEGTHSGSSALDLTDPAHGMQYIN